MAACSNAFHQELERKRHTQRTAGASLLKYLLGLKVQEKITAKDLGICCHYLQVGEMPGASWGTYATSPDADSGKFNNKCVSALPPLGNT